MLHFFLVTAVAGRGEESSAWLKQQGKVNPYNPSVNPERENVNVFRNKTHGVPSIFTLRFLNL